MEYGYRSRKDYPSPLHPNLRNNPTSPLVKEYTSSAEETRSTFAPYFNFLNLKTVDWNLCFAITSIVVFLAIFAITIAGLALVLSNNSDVDELNDFSKRLVNDYFSDKCVQCDATGGKLIYLEAGVNPLQIELEGEALGKTHFPFGFTTPCETCDLSSPSISFSLQANSSRIKQDLSVESGFLSAARFHINENGITYDALNLWTQQHGITNSTNGGISNLTSSQRCNSKTLGSIYTVVSSSSTSIEVCCDYYLCMCILNGNGDPNEYCTHELINVNTLSTQPKLNCILGNTTLGCDCGNPIC